MKTKKQALISYFNRKLLVVFSILLIIPITIILFISPITKYLIEKYDVKYTGREIKMDWAYVNPFTGYLHFSNLKVYELHSDTTFISSEGLSINLSLLKLFSNTIEINKINLDRPVAIFKKNKDDYNFKDLVKLFSGDGLTDSVRSGMHFNIENISINDGTFAYRDQQIPINYFIKHVNIESDGKQWNSDTTNLTFSFVPGIGSGKILGNLNINFNSLKYRFGVVINKFDLSIIGQYLKDLTNNGTFTATLDANIKSNGNFSDAEDMTTTGKLQINDFHFGKNKSEDYASFEKLVLGINMLSPKNHKYLFDSLILSHPYFKYEIYDSLDNIQNMFGANGSIVTNANADQSKFNLIIEMARYVKILSKNFFKSNYRIHRLAIEEGDIKFNDYSMSEKFSISLSPLWILADSIDKNHKDVKVALKTGIVPYGNAEISLTVNPNDSETFHMQYKLEHFPATLFNPYTIAYTSFPLDRGTIELNGIWNVYNGMIKSENHLVILDPRVTKKIRKKDNQWLPLPLIMSFIRERGNVIDYKIPISGNLKNPEFHLHDVVFDVIRNIFVKPATTSYRFELKNTEAEIEKSLTVRWAMKNSKLTPMQDRFIKAIAEFLKENPEASIEITPELYKAKEEEYILMYQAKMKYLLTKHFINAALNEDDSEKTEAMSVKDPLFINYLNKRVNDTMIFTTQEKCSKIINSKIINIQLEKLNKERKDAFVTYFRNTNTESQVSFMVSKNVVPYDGFSFFKIHYTGEFPPSVTAAYKKLNELNDESPRDKFRKDRQNNRVIWLNK